MSSDTEYNDLQDPDSNEEETGIADESIDSWRGSQDSLDQAEYSHSSYQASTTGEGVTMPSPTPPPPLKQRQSPQVAATTGDSEKYPPSPPFEEAGPTSSVWRAYLDEGESFDTNMLEKQREEVNRLLIFAGLFCSVVSNFLPLSSENLEPDYEAMSASLLFDQINIQLALANGTPLDDITTSGTDPTAPFIPARIDQVINALWLTSFALSLATAFFAILVDARYCDHVSPIPGEPKVRARTRHLRYKRFIKWNIRRSITIIQLLSHFSLITFAIGLVISVSQGLESIPLFIIFPLGLLFYVFLPITRIADPESLWKTPLDTFMAFATCERSQITAVLGLTSSLEVKSLSEVNKVQAFEIYAARESCVENEVDALHWLYQRSSTSTIHRLVIHALAGLSQDYIAHAKKVFFLRWAEIRDEKDRMLMDCMELTQDGTTRWIPKDIPNIGGRIEPLLRLEILFPALRRKFPSRLFGEHHLDFSRKLSNTLLITLSSIDDERIQKPAEQNQVFMDALADNGVHHPLVWKKLLDLYGVNEELFHDWGDAFTIEMCLNLVTRIYLPEDSPPESYSCTLAHALITSHKKEILTGLLAFFSTSESHNDAVDQERRLSLAIVRTLAPDPAPSTYNSNQPHPFHHDSTISKYQLLCVALRGIDKYIYYHLGDDSSKQWRTDVFQAILSYMKSDLFTGRSLGNLGDSVWTCRSHALVCMASLMRRGPEYSAVEPNEEWVTKPLFVNILRVIHDDRVADTPRLSAIPDFPDPLQHVDPMIGAAGFILGQIFSWEIPGAYEAFREQKGLGDIAVRKKLHSELIAVLRGYITGISNAKARNLPAIQSDDFLDWHIQDLHQVHVIGFVCASITYSGTPWRRILSSLVSIDPNHSEWDAIVKTLSENDEYSFEKYILDRDTLPDDQEHLKESMKVTVRILAECWEGERDRRNGANSPSKNFGDHISSVETRRKSRSRKGKERVQDLEGGH